MKFHIKTLGCKMNWLDSSKITASLIASGNTETDFDDADTVLVNSCTVTQLADKKSLTEAKKAAKAGKQLVIFGCSANMQKSNLEQKFPEALVFDSEEKILAHFGATDSTELFPSSDRTRLPIAIQTGCDCACTFCITHQARGKSQNFPAEKIIQNIQQAENLGIKEIVLTGINIGAYGCEDSNNAEQSQLAQLLVEILKKTSIPRIRLSSLGPQYLREDFFEVFQDPRICDYLHLSLQSGSDEVLRNMGRRYTREDILQIAKRARETRPDVALATDIIVGFPGESDLDFEQTCELVSEIGCSKLHVFPYSPRDGTPAAHYEDQIPDKVKKSRAGRLRQIGAELRQTFIEKNLGKTFSVLSEGKGIGLTTNYISVQTPELKKNTIREITLMKSHIMNPKS